MLSDNSPQSCERTCSEESYKNILHAPFERCKWVDMVVTERKFSNDALVVCFYMINHIEVHTGMSPRWIGGVCVYFNMILIH